MKTIELQKIFAEQAPDAFQRYPAVVKESIVRLLERITCMNDINAFIQLHHNASALDFIDEIFEHTEASLLVSLRDKMRIPSEGKLVIVANHPLGGLDGLAILRAVKEVRSDVRIVANSLLMEVGPLSECFLPVNVFTSKDMKQNVRAIDSALERNEAVVFFPAGEVSRLSIHGVTDAKWQQGPVRFAKRHEAPVLPIFVDSRNSLLFYIISLIARPLSTLLLPRELLHGKKKRIHLRVGNPVAANAFSLLRSKSATQLFRKQAQALKSGRKGPFKTERVVIHPVESRKIRKDLFEAIDMGSPAEGKRLYLTTSDRAPSVFREICRLREQTFRKIGEGTGRSMDADSYDRHYHHLIVWDERELEIAGSYRLGIGPSIVSQQGSAGFYTNSLFDFKPEMEATLPASIEMGRSFIQEKYWNSYVLEYLWAGIGTIITKVLPVRSLFGPVSISGVFSNSAKESIVYVYKKWFSPETSLAVSHSPYSIPSDSRAQLDAYFQGENYREDHNRLKQRLQTMQLSIPPLFRQYVDLCAEQGVRFHDFGVDKDFGNCVDGFITLDVAMLKEEKRKRYIEKYAATLLPRDAVDATRALFVN